MFSRAVDFPKEHQAHRDLSSTRPCTSLADSDRGAGLIGAVVGAIIVLVISGMSERRRRAV